MTRFWEWRSPRAAGGATALAAEPEPDFQPVEVYLRNALVVGMVEPLGQRLSDILNTNTTLALKDAHSTSLLPDVDGTEGSGWTRIDRDEILFVMPPTHESPRQLRVHRRQRRVRIQTGEYEVVGNAHVPPGTTLDPFVLVRRVHFIAVTDAYVAGSGAYAFERSAPVTLVNVGPIHELREVLTLG